MKRKKIVKIIWILISTMVVFSMVAWTFGASLLTDE